MTYTFAVTLTPQQGGTGFASTTAGNVGKALTVASSSPFRYTFTSLPTGAVSTSSPITANHFPFWVTTAGGLSGTSTLTVSNGTATLAGTLKVNQIVGPFSDIVGLSSINMGDTNVVTGYAGGAFGYSNTLSGDQGGVFGESNSVAGLDAFAAGRSNTVTSDYSFAMGRTNTIEDDTDHSAIFGNNNQIKFISGGGGQAFVAGDSNVVYAAQSGALGQNNLVQGIGVNPQTSWAIGSNNTVDTTDSLAFGQQNHVGDLLAVGQSVAIGTGNNASSSYVNLFGNFLQSTAPKTVVIGNGIVAGFKLSNSATGTIMLGSSSTVPTVTITPNPTGATDGIGKVGIGTTQPSSTLHVVGDIRTTGDVYSATSTKGLVLTSPDGTCYRLTVSDLGVLSTNSITCP